MNLPFPAPTARAARARAPLAALAAAALLTLAACGGGGDGGDPAPPTSVTVSLATVPAGLALTLDGRDAPASFSGTPGNQHTIAAATSQTLNGRLYEFSGWSQGGAAVQTVTVPNANVTYTASFTDRGPTTNRPPTVVLMTVPTTGRVGQTLNVSGAAQDPDAGDSIPRMQLLVNGAAVAETTTAPFLIVWTPTAAGTFALRMRAFDSFGLTKDSAAVDVVVSP